MIIGKTIPEVFAINKDNEIVSKEQPHRIEFGRCTRCQEMTSLQDPCCWNVPIEYMGDLVMPKVAGE